MEYKLTRRERERLIHKSEIMEAAEKLFIAKGIEGTSMDDIAKESQFTKRTLYQYFENKEDLYFAVATIAAKRLMDTFEEAIKSSTSGFEKIRNANIAYYKFYKEHTEIFKLINYKFTSSRHSSAHYKEMLDQQKNLIQMFTEIFEEGKQDGSINSKLDSKISAQFGIFFTIGFLNETANLSEDYYKYIGFSKDDFLLNGLELLTNAISPK